MLPCALCQVRWLYPMCTVVRKGIRCPAQAIVRWFRRLSRRPTGEQPVPDAFSYQERTLAMIPATLPWPLKADSEAGRREARVRAQESLPAPKQRNFVAIRREVPTSFGPIANEGPRQKDSFTSLVSGLNISRTNVIRPRLVALRHRLIACSPMELRSGWLIRPGPGHRDTRRRASVSSGDLPPIVGTSGKPQERATVRTDPQAANGMADRSPRLARALFQKRHAKADSRTPASP